MRIIVKAIAIGLLFALVLTFLAYTCTASMIYVPGNYSTIQAAVNAASPGDTIIVREGTYIENVVVNVNDLTVQTETGSTSTIVQAADPGHHVFEITADSVKLSGFTVTGASLEIEYPAGIYLYNADSCIISKNIASNNGFGIHLSGSSNNMITNNTVSKCLWGIHLSGSSNNIFSNNTANVNNFDGISLSESSNNTLSDNAMSGNRYNFWVEGGYNLSYFIQRIDTSNKVNGKPIYYLVDQKDKQIPNDAVFVGIVNSTNITVKDLTLTNNGQGVLFAHTRNSRIENVAATHNAENVYSEKSSNIWNSPEKITYTYNGSTYTNYLGNYWHNYTSKDANNDGIWDKPYILDSDWDYHPLVMPWTNYIKLAEEEIFDTDSPANPYPSIMGIHNGKIIPSHNVTVNKMYTYPCAGTGGHSEYVWIYGNGINESATWNGYRGAGDYHYIDFSEPFTLDANVTYNYTIKTGSYPQIHHNTILTVPDGEISCAEFIDANGKIYYYDWIPAIRLS